MGTFVYMRYICVLTLCLAIGSGTPGRESEADPAQVSLTIIQITRKS